MASIPINALNESFALDQNTRYSPYAEKTRPDLTIRADDILFLDLGPVFENWEADFGRTFVLGTDPLKHKLRKDVGDAFAEGKRYFEENPDILSCELYACAQSLAIKFGWEFGGTIAGHLIGQFPHEKIAGDKVTLYVHPQSRLRMRSLDEQARIRHWILEIHFYRPPPRNRRLLRRTPDRVMKV